MRNAPQGLFLLSGLRYIFAMKLFLDDLRPAPPGYTACRWPQDVISLLQQYGAAVQEISLDYNLGESHLPNGRTGLDVLLWMEEAAITGSLKHLPQIKLHTNDPIGRTRMEEVLAGIRYHIKFIEE